MAKKQDDLQKHTLHLRAGDYARLQELYPETGAAAIVRAIVSAHLEKVDPPINTDLIKSTPAL